MRILLTLASLFISGFTYANCEITIEANDAMQYSSKELNISKSCESTSINLIHTGQLPKNAMGHNIVIVPKNDLQEIAIAGLTAGLDKGFVPDDDRIIAASALIGGKETTTMQINSADLKEGVEYAFFCSFPGHFAVMQGDIKLTD